MTHQTPNNEKPKQLSFHACADYANDNLLESCCAQSFHVLALYTHVHVVHMLPSFHVLMHVLKKVREGERYTRRRERVVDVGAGLLKKLVLILICFIVWSEYLFYHFIIAFHFVIKQIENI